jgi:hypothetical protein
VSSGGARRVWRVFLPSGYKYYCMLARSRYNLSRSQKFVKVQDFNCGQMCALTAVASAKAGVRVQEPLQINLDCRSKSKNRDKQLTHNVRVISRPYFKSQSLYLQHHIHENLN